MSRRGVFLDLNGTLVEPLKQERLDELTLIPGVVDGIARLTAAGFVCPVVTIQSRIGKGLFSLAEFQAWFAAFAESLKAQGAHVVGPYVCPHLRAEPCACKKPNTLLYDRAASDYQLVPAESFVIGDSPEDVAAARRLGARGCLVRTGWASDPAVVEKARQDATMVADSFTQAVDWIMGLAAAEADSIESVKALEKKLHKAMVEKDTRTVAGLLTRDFIRTPPTTPATTKEQWIALLENGGVSYVLIEMQDPQYRVFGDTVLSHSVVHARVHLGAEDTNLTLRALHVWVRQNGAWRLAALQANMMASD